MAGSHRKVLRCVLLLLAALLADSVAANKQVDTLTTKREKTKDGVLKWSSKDFDRYMGGQSRPFSVLIFCTASHMPKTESLRIPELRHNMGQVASQYRATHKQAPRIFFVEMDFANSQSSFASLGVQSVPNVMHIGPQEHSSHGQWVLARDDRMKPEDYKVFPWRREDFAHFVTQRAHIDAALLRVPSLHEHPAVRTLLAVSFAFLVYLAVRGYCSGWFEHPLIWTSAVLLVFWFATSGGLFNIIRGAPLITPGPMGEIVWFSAPHAQGQLGAEGFFIGSLYIAFALSVTAIILLPKWLGATAKCKVLSYAALLTAFFTCLKVVDFYTFKTGYSVRIYLLESMSIRRRMQ